MRQPRFAASLLEAELLPLVGQEKCQVLEEGDDVAGAWLARETVGLKEEAKIPFRCGSPGTKKLLREVIGRVTVLAVALKGYGTQGSIADRLCSFFWLISETFEQWLWTGGQFDSAWFAAFELIFLG
jgi:hypothetical protein